MKNIIIIALLLVFSIPSFAQEQTYAPYNENQDARADIKSAIARAQKENKNVMIQMGGNWCSWCMRFHKLVNGVPAVDSLMNDNYVYVLLNIPREKEKRDNMLMQEYQFPNRFGFPVFVILDKTGKEIHVQDSDAFEYPNPAVKGYDTTKVKRFLSLWTPKSLDPVSYKTK